MGWVDGTTGLTLPAGRSALASLSRPGGQPVGLGHPFDMATSGGTSTGASRPEGRASQDLVTSQRSRTGRSGPSDRRERVTERHHCPVNSDEHGAKHDARSGMEQMPARSGTTKPGASSGPDPGRETRGMVRVAAERRSTVPVGGADGGEAKGARCPVNRS